jgi:hypothetical protein
VQVRGFGSGADSRAFLAAGNWAFSVPTFVCLCQLERSRLGSVSLMGHLHSGVQVGGFGSGADSSGFSSRWGLGFLSL